MVETLAEVNMEQPFLSAPSDEEIELMSRRMAETELVRLKASARRSKAQAAETKAKKDHAKACAAYARATGLEAPDDDDDDD